MLVLEDIRNPLLDGQQCYQYQQNEHLLFISNHWIQKGQDINADANRGSSRTDTKCGIIKPSNVISTLLFFII
jgi:hypothetical protein